MDSNDAKTLDHKLVAHKGFYLINEIHDPDDVDQICNLEIRDSDTFVVTYPKSGTIWMQQILLMLKAKGDVTAISELSNLSNAEVIPWIELRGNREAFISAPTPRQRVTHLQYQFLPPALSQKIGKSFEDFFEKFLRGEVFGSSWFEHIKTWYSHKDEMNMLFITYEEMIKDLKSAVEKISLFLGQKLTDEQLANVVKHSTFNNMKRIPQASYEQVPEDLLSHHLGTFMRKGTIGDWKNHLTVAQSERFDEVFLREMKDFPFLFSWDIEDFK
ncbi:amine sulfotransferase-like isoform 2-T2 [Odontesthes bonariensis]|uniref:amine sulfotransferase-like isoform X2 n=1 Tax=Odontesthes bonariensis TaxID=219752 RepID=UPI003F58BA06